MEKSFLEQSPKSAREKEAESDKRAEELIRKLAEEIFNGAEKDKIVDELDELRDEFEALNELDSDYFSPAEKERFDNISKKLEVFINKINKGEAMNDEEVELLKKSKDDLRTLIIKAHKKYPDFHRKEKTAAHPSAIVWKKEQKPPPAKKIEASDYQIRVPEELKEDPNIKIVVESIQRDIYLIIEKAKGRILPEALDAIGHNAESRRWFSFVKNNPEKAKEIAEKYADQFPQIQHALSKMGKGVFTEEESEQIPPKAGGDNLAVDTKDVREGVVLKRGEEEKPKQTTRRERTRETKDSWKQAMRILSKRDEERIKFAQSEAGKPNIDEGKLEELSGGDIIEQIPYTFEELEAKRKQEAADLGIPTVEFYGESDKEKTLKEEAEKLGIPTTEDKEKEPVLPAENVKPISTDKKTLDKFAELGISSSDLEKIEGFGDLTAGQHCLVLESFEQLVLGKIKEDALEQHKEEVKKSGFLGRIKKGITKKYQIAKIEKSVAEDLAKAGIASQEDIIRQLVKSVKEQGTDAVINKEGELEIKYISGLENLSSHDQKTIDRFNEAAAEFSKIPYEWSLETAASWQKAQFKKIKNELDGASIFALQVLREKKGLEKTQEIFLDIQNKIKFNQFISTHPEVEKQLKDIKTRPALRRIWKDIVAERGAYFGVGWGVRGVSASLLAVGGAGVGVVISGAGFAAWRTNSALKEQDMLARRGKGLPQISDEQRKELNEQIKKLEEKGEWLKFRFPEYFKAENDYLEQITKLNKKGQMGESPSAQEVEMLEAFKEKYEKERVNFEINPLAQDYFSQKSEYDKLRNEIFPDKKTDEEERRKNVVAAEPMVQKIEALLNKIESEADKDKKQKFVESLRVRLAYTDKKLKNGLVNFGSYENRLLKNCNLMNSIQRANATLAVFGNPKLENELEKRLEKFLDLKKQKISKARRKYILKEAGKGAVYGALFFGLGYGTRWLWEEYGHNVREFFSDLAKNLPEPAVMIGGGHFYEEAKEAVAVPIGRGQLGAGVSVEEVVTLAPSVPKAGEIMKEIQVQGIGKRGPEGAIIDYFRKNELVARQFGYGEHMDFDKWAGTKAHQLWLEQARKAIEDPQMQSQLAKLGYTEENYLAGYEEMMRHIDHGGVKIDISNGKVDLVDMEYLKFHAAGLEDMPTEPQIDEGLPAQVGISAGIQIDEGAAPAGDYAATEAFDNVISVNALPSVEKFAFSDLDFSVGEFAAIKNISAEKLLKEIPSNDEAWAIWRGEVEGKSINLPHYETYWYTQFRRQVNLAEFIRKIVKDQKIKPDILKTVSIGKFIEKYIVLQK